MNETLDDIVSWIREIAQSYKQSTAYDKVTIEGLKVCFALEKIAARIDAATRENRFHYRTYEEAVCEFINQVHGIVKFDANDEFARWLFNKKVEVAK